MKYICEQNILNGYLLLILPALFLCKVHVLTDISRSTPILDAETYHCWVGRYCIPHVNIFWRRSYDHNKKLLTHPSLYTYCLCQLCVHAGLWYSRMASSMYTLQFVQLPWSEYICCTRMPVHCNRKPPMLCWKSVALLLCQSYALKHWNKCLLVAYILGCFISRYGKLETEVWILHFKVSDLLHFLRNMNILWG
jgi:hypothetical protein